MSNQKLFVPIIKESPLLYSVKAIPAADFINTWWCNGGPLPPALAEIACNYFDKSIHPAEISFIGKEGRPKWRLDDSTKSVYLGFFIEMVRFAKGRSFKSEWNSITVTGTLNITDGIIKLADVGDVDKKILAVKEYAEQHKDEKHLFIYVCGEKPVEPGWYDNLEVKAFCGEDPIGVVFAEIFEPKFNKEQNALFQKADLNKQWEYVSTSVFEIIKRKALSADWNGYLIHGEGESGKSAMAYELAKYLACAERIYAPVWIRVENDKLRAVFNRDSSALSSAEKKEKRDVLDDLLTFHFANLISDALDFKWNREDGLLSLINQIDRPDSPYLIIIDNLEIDGIDKILKAVRAIIKSCRTKPPVILTSRIKDDALMNLEKISPSELTHDEIEKLVWNVAKEQGPDGLNEHIITLNEHKGSSVYYEFINALFIHFSTFPGLITVVAAMLDRGLPDVIKTLGELRLLDESIEKKAEAIYKNVYSQLDLFTRFMLFMIVHISLPWKYITSEIVSIEKLSDIMIGSIKDDRENNKRRKYSTPFFSQDDYKLTKSEIEQKTRQSITKLLCTHLVNRDISSFSEENGKFEYYVKTLPIKFLLFSKSVEGFRFSTDDERIYACVYYKQSPYLIEDIIKKNDVWFLRPDYSVLFIAAAWSVTPEYIDVLYRNGYKKINSPLYDHKDFPYNPTALHVAAQYNENISVIKRLLELGARVTKKDAYGRTPLHLAAKNNSNKEILALLLEKGAKINSCGNVNETPLLLAAYFNQNPEIVIFLLKNGADKYARDRNGWFLLNFAARNDNPDVFKQIVKYDRTLLDYVIINGKKYEYKELDANSPLIDFLVNGIDPDIVSWLEEVNIDINTKISDAGSSLLHYAAWNNDETIFTGLLAAGARTDIVNNDGDTVLHYAVFNSNLTIMGCDIIGLLLEKGLDIHTVNTDGMTPLHSAVLNNEYPENVAFLLDKGAIADIDAKECNGSTPLHLAALINENPDIINLLLERGASINARNNYGETPLHCAPDNENPEIAIKLIKAGANPDDVDDFGVSALSLLKKRKDWLNIKKATADFYPK
ncbi:MAG: ankyrin repeat domain-containing protein [Treponema sp.]|nr:ankyrin repeat domain-containing protein [Treponema sp.]